jgi:hypothetical protein
MINISAHKMFYKVGTFTTELVGLEYDIHVLLLDADVHHELNDSLYEIETTGYPLIKILDEVD